MDEKPQNDYLNASPLGNENNSSQIPTPPQSHHSQHHSDEEDYSDAPSPDSQQPQLQRRRSRGGRKPKQLGRSAQHLQSVSEIEIPRSHPQPQEEEQDFIDDESEEEEAPISPLLAPPEGRNRDNEYDEDALSKARGTRKQVKKIPPRPPARPKPTGISALKVERPRGGGRKPPIAVSVERPGENTKSKSKIKGGNNGRQTKPVEETVSHDIADDENDEEEQEPEESRPVRIRLDLNLELDILFKAKIKGDVTITFLE